MVSRFLSEWLEQSVEQEVTERGAGILMTGPSDGVAKCLLSLTCSANDSHINPV